MCLGILNPASAQRDALDDLKFLCSPKFLWFYVDGCQGLLPFCISAISTNWREWCTYIEVLSLLWRVWRHTSSIFMAHHLTLMIDHKPITFSPPKSVPIMLLYLCSTQLCSLASASMRLAIGTDGSIQGFRRLPPDSVELTFRAGSVDVFKLFQVEALTIIWAMLQIRNNPICTSMWGYS